MWVTKQSFPKENRELEIFDGTFLLESFSEGIKLYQRSEEKWNLLNIVSTTKKQMRFSVLPKAYELPVFVQFEQPLDIYPKREINFFIKVPFRASIYLQSDSETWELTCVEKTSLKQIWDGDVTAAGNLYYHYISPVILKGTSGEESPLVPIALKHVTENVQRIERAVIEGRYLTVYQTKGGLVTSAVEASLSEGGEMKVTYLTETTPKLRKESALLSSPLVPPETPGIISPLRKLRSIFEVGP